MVKASKREMDMNKKFKKRLIKIINMEDKQKNQLTHNQCH